MCMYMYRVYISKMYMYMYVHCDSSDIHAHVHVCRRSHFEPTKAIVEAILFELVQTLVRRGSIGEIHVHVYSLRITS